VNLHGRNVLVRLALAVILLAAVPAWAEPCPTGPEEKFQQNYALPAGGSVSLANVNGSVRIEGWGKNFVEVQAVKRAVKDRQDLERVRIEVEALRTAVNIRTRYPENNPAGVEVDYRIRVPYRISLARVETVNGNLLVSGVEGTGELRTVNGNVDVYDSAGRFSGKTTNGDVRVELRRLAAAGAMALESITGSVALALPQDAGAVLDVRSINGEFRTELPLTMPSALGREFRGNLGRGGMTVRLRTVNGGIEIVTLRATI